MKLKGEVFDKDFFVRRLSSPDDKPKTAHEDRRYFTPRKTPRTPSKPAR